MSTKTLIVGDSTRYTPKTTYGTGTGYHPWVTVDLNQNVSKSVSRSCYKNVFQELDEMWTASDAIPRYVDRKLCFQLGTSFI